MNKNFAFLFLIIASCSDIKFKKRPPLNMENTKKQCEILVREKRWISDAEIENLDKSSYKKMMEIVDFGVVRSCSSHRPTEEQIFATVRKSISEKEIADNILQECIDDFFEIHHKIYNIVGFACQLEFARKAHTEKIDMNIILDCVNNNLFGTNAIVKVSENIIKNMESSIREEILNAGCGSLWKDQMKYNFVRHKLFGERNTLYIRSSFKREERYQHILEKVYDFGCDSHALNCKYYIARNFIKHGIDKKLICKIFNFTNDEFEEFVKPID
ncbi:MAG: hypothetical protein LBJ71_02530 [Holosporaceae bacterium]|nr:hypothetical protein [Holosporaceae bacterium]